MLFLFFFGGNDEVEVGDRLIKLLGKGANAAGQLNIRNAAAALERCRVFLGNDTGTTHLAASVKTPCVAIFAAIDWAGRWYPFGELNTVFREIVECEACHSPICFNDNKCLKLIEPEKVVQACFETWEISDKIVMSKKTILVLADYYLPGSKGGGTLRTIANMIDRLGKIYEFKVITRDQDGPDAKNKYKNVDINQWNRLNGTDIYYISNDKIKLNYLDSLISDTNPDCLYISSCFSVLTIKILLLKKLGKIKNLPLIIAPVGELVDGALSIKPLKKQVFIKIARQIDLYKNVIWKTSGIAEKENVEKLRVSDDPVFVAPDLSPRHIYREYDQNKKPIKERGKANFVFLSRFDRKKNFKWFLENIGSLKGEICIDIYAPIEDEVYWQECKLIIEKLPENYKVQYKGALHYEEVVKTLFNYNFFVLPTLGENFGHVFLEALSAGCPLLISDRNPWQNLCEKNIGWDLPLEKPQLWQKQINDCVEMENSEYNEMSRAARAFSENWLSDESQEKATINVIEYALSS